MSNRTEDGQESLRQRFGNFAHARHFSAVNPAYPHYGSQNSPYKNEPSYAQAAQVRTLVKTLLGTDTMCPDTQNVPEKTILNLYHEKDGANAELGAALELKCAELARELLKKPLKIIWGPTIDKTVAKTNAYAKLSEATIAFLAVPENRDKMRARFPEAGLTDEYIDALLGGRSPGPALAGLS